MGMAELVVTAVVFEGRSKSEVARDYGISRRWVITLVQRYLAEGDAGLEPRSRRPRRSPGQTAAAVEDEIIKIRKDLDKAGHEAGPKKLKFRFHSLVLVQFVFLFTLFLRRVLEKVTEALRGRCRRDIPGGWSGRRHRSPARRRRD